MILGSQDEDSERLGPERGPKRQAEIQEMYEKQWLTEAPQVLYTPLHWLGYWNDYPSIGFLLSQVDKSDPVHIERIMSRTSTDLTPLDIAARNKSNDAALLFLQYFEKNFDIVIDVFRRADQELRR